MLKPTRPLTTVLLALMGIAAHGDVRYTTKMTTANSPVAVMTTTWTKGKRQRVETVTDMGQFKSKSVMLTMCDKRLTATLDPDLKIYTVKSMEALDPKPEPGATVATGTVTNTYTVKDMGVETVANLKAHHWMVTTHSVGTGCIGTFDNTSKVEVWTAPIEVFNCWDNNSYSQPTCRVKYVEKGDVKLMRSAYNGMPVRMVFYQGDQKTSEQTFVDHSTAALDQGLFELPADFKKVTDAEFQAQQQQKMMKQYQVPTP